MKNIFVIPTKESSRIGYIYESKSYHMFSSGENPNDIPDNLAVPMHFYLVGENKVEDGDWFINGTKVFKALRVTDHNVEFYTGNECITEKYTDFVNIKNVKKIIVTNDKKLIKDGVLEFCLDYLTHFTTHPRDNVKINRMRRKDGSRYVTTPISGDRHRLVSVDISYSADRKLEAPCPPEVPLTKVEDNFDHRHCSTCNLGQEGSCELELETKCISNTGNEDHGDYWIDVNDDDDDDDDENEFNWTQQFKPYVYPYAGSDMLTNAVDEEVVSINSQACENIADNLAIQFAEWCDNNYFRVGNSSQWCESFIFSGSPKFTTQELLIKFKTQLQK